MKIAVLGSGSFGSSLAQVLLDNNHEVSMWSHIKEAQDLFLDPKNTYIDQSLKSQLHLTTNIDIIKDQDIVVVVVPSFALRQTAKAMQPYLNPDTIVVLCTKGIEQENLKTGQQVLDEELNMNKFCILSGPTHAEEIAKRMFTAIVATSNDIQVAKVVQQAFNNSYFRVYTNTDIKGVELAGAVKNILAIAAGYCDSSPHFGDNTKALLLTRGLRELKILTQHVGGNVNTIYGLTGVGDLMVTAFSKHSRNRRFGELLGKGLSVSQAQEEIGMVVEGYYSLLAVHQIIKQQNLDLPVINIIYDAIYHQKNIDTIVENAVLRSLKSED